MESVKHRTQISIENWQYQILLEMSKKLKKSLSGIIRDLLTEKFSKETAKPEKDSICEIIGIGAGDGLPVAREHDRFLYAKRKGK